jgi:hypothetical protein
LANSNGVKTAFWRISKEIRQKQSFGEFQRSQKKKLLERYGTKKERAAITASQTPENPGYGFEKPTESSLLVCGGKDMINHFQNKRFTHFFLF